MKIAAAFLALTVSLAAQPAKVLLVTGGHDHPPSFYSVFDDARLKTNVDPHPNAFSKDFKKYDVLVLYDLVRELPEEKIANLKAFVEAGKGVVVLHHAICDYPNWEWWYKDVVGGKYRSEPDAQGPPGSYKHDETVPVTVVKKHPITEGISDFVIRDETYKGMYISPKVDVLLKTTNPTSDGPVAWIGPYPKARVVMIQLGHDEQAHRNPNYQRLVRNAILWAAGSGAR